jgi:hypothetical protein
MMEGVNSTMIFCLNYMGYNLAWGLAQAPQGFQRTVMFGIVLHGPQLSSIPEAFLWGWPVLVLANV